MQADERTPLSRGPPAASPSWRALRIFAELCGLRALHFLILRHDLRARA
jgi:hypothetical protein